MIERSDILNNQAITLAAEGNFKDAIACFKRALVIEKENYLLWYNLGITYRDAGDLRKAKDSLATAYKIKDFVFDLPFFIGVFISFLVGIFVIKFLLEYLKKGSFKLFAIYRVILGIAVLGFLLIK